MVRSGWPGHQAGWINLHASRWLQLSRRRAAGATSQARLAPRAGANGEMRVGILGAFSGLLSFPRDLFADIPDGITVCIFDMPFRGQSAEFLRPLVTEYVPLPEGAGQIDAAARAADAADLDLLMVIGPTVEAYQLLDRVRTRVVMNYCTGSDLMHHERLDFQMHGQPQADYFVKDRSMFCTLTGRALPGATVLPIDIGFYDRRGLPLSGPPWCDREPLIVFHGSLYKLAFPGMLDTVLSLLADDSNVSLALVGKDDGAALEAIRREAAKRGVAARVHYEGSFSAVRDDRAGVSDPTWNRLIELLSKARLAPDPFPIGGGSSRFEAYALGAPSVHLGVRFDEDAWGRPQDAACDVLFLNTTLGTAFDRDDYRRVAQRCLSDASFADALAAEQLAVAARLVDARAWWTRLRSAADGWSAQ
jgi:hypothetical protein